MSKHHWHRPDLAYVEQAARIMCTLAAAAARLIQALHGG